MTENLFEKLTYLIKTSSAYLLDLVYPRFCLACQVNLQGTDNAYYVCLNCANKIEKISQTDACLKCGESLGPYVGTRRRCRNCETIHLKFDRAIGAARYDGVLRELIHRYKYNGEKLLVDFLAELLKNKLADENGLLKEINLIIPVPLHPARLRERGFNQSELLARYLSRSLNIPVSQNHLVRVKKLPPQATLSRPERLRNLRDAFNVKNINPFKNKNILLIDDVLTTGATASSIADTLKKAGAGKVYVAVVGR
ncbi:MAG: ComF family protein [Planctomycetota bacterium]